MGRIVPGGDLGLMAEEGTLNILITHSTIDAADEKDLLGSPPPRLVIFALIMDG